VDDPGEQIERVAAMAPRDELLEPVEEAGPIRSFSEVVSSSSRTSGSRSSATISITLTLAEWCTRPTWRPRSSPASSTTANEIVPARDSAKRSAASIRFFHG